MAEGGRFLHLALGEDRFALPAGLVREVVRPGPVTRLPGRPEALAGLANHRGAALPVLDLARLLGRRPCPSGRLVVARAGETVGLLVGRVLGLASGTDGAETLDLTRLLAGMAPPRRPPPGAPRIADRPAAREAAAITALLRLRGAGRPCAVPLDAVEEIAALPPDFRPAPGPHAAALGRMAWRGGALPLLSLDAILGADAAPTGPSHRVAILRGAAGPVGLVAAAVGPVLRLAREAVDPLPRALRRSAGAVAAVARLDDGDLLPVLAADRLAAEAGGREEPAPGPALAPREAPILVVRIAGRDYGLPAAAVSEVLRAPAAATRLPGAPAACLGLVALRGEALPVYDLRAGLGHPPGPAAPDRRLLVLDGADPVGLVVDSVLGLRAASRDGGPAPDLLDPASLRFGLARARPPAPSRREDAG